MITLAAINDSPEDLVPQAYSIFRVGHNNLRNFIGDRQLKITPDVHMLFLRQASQLRLVLEEVENPLSSGGVFANELLESFCGELLAHVERYYPTGIVHEIDLQYRRKILIMLLYSYAIGGKNYQPGPYSFGLSNVETRYALGFRGRNESEARWRIQRDQARARIQAYRDAIRVVPLPDQVFNDDLENYPVLVARQTEHLVEPSTKRWGLKVWGEGTETPW